MDRRGLVSGYCIWPGYFLTDAVVTLFLAVLFLEPFFAVLFLVV